MDSIPLKPFNILLKMLFNYSAYGTGPKLKVSVTGVDGLGFGDLDAELSVCVQDFAVTLVASLGGLPFNQRFYDQAMHLGIEYIRQALRDPNSVFSRRFTGLLEMSDVRTITRITQSIPRRWHVFDEVSPRMSVFSAEQMYKIIFKSVDHPHLVEAERQIQIHPEARENYLQAQRRWVDLQPVR